MFWYLPSLFQKDFHLAEILRCRYAYLIIKIYSLLTLYFEWSEIEAWSNTLEISAQSSWVPSLIPSEIKKSQKTRPENHRKKYPNLKLKIWTTMMSVPWYRNLWRKLLRKMWLLRRLRNLGNNKPMITKNFLSLGRRQPKISTLKCHQWKK